MDHKCFCGPHSNDMMSDISVRNVAVRENLVAGCEGSPSGQGLVFAVGGCGVLTESGNTGYESLHSFVDHHTAHHCSISNCQRDVFYFIICTTRWFAYPHCELGPPDLEVRRGLSKTNVFFQQYVCDKRV
jgi:hypothetical protein